MTVELFEADRHEQVGDVEWSEPRASLAIKSLVDSVLDRRGPEGLWLTEDQPDWFGLTLYGGAAGIAWSCAQLLNRGLISGEQLPLLSDLEIVEQLWAGCHASCAHFNIRPAESYLLGRVGFLLQLFAETGAASLLDELDERIGNNLDHPWMENLWGAPATMIAATHLFRATGESRFASHLVGGVEYLWERLVSYPELGCRLWQIDLYGERVFLLGAGHGFVGNVFAVLNAADLLEESDRHNWYECVIDTVLSTALRSNGTVNWPPSLGEPRKGRGAILVQHCHGAPGFVIDLASLYGMGNAAFDTVLEEAGELVWQAGPLIKYPGLCHGTAGNGYAFLKLYACTGKTLWLERARVFAMAALAQRDKRIAEGRSQDLSLWSGDMGIAMFIADCLQEQPRFPTMDYFF